MASIIKPIEAKSIHQIQSGQVIVDLCSVVKELVENALDADATAIEVRFKNNGLDAIEVQDNGTGISESNYENLALKHYTSKLSTYEDLLNVKTFGFRGEALSSLCALSQFSVVTAQAHEAPKGRRLEFELSGKLKSISLTAAQKGTIATVENLFANLPVRQKELAKNVKREYGKVIGLLQAYACVSIQVKFTVKNATAKARSSVVFSTQGNYNTRENIANVYGAKMLSQLLELNLQLKLPSTMTRINGDGPELASVVVAGHISRPVFGEGRQTPDRQMFFVNGRPCGLPQISKAINEVYKAYNVSQSPFIFADFQMDTNAYDVNVSPDKRTILLHDAAALIDLLKTALTERFDDTEQTVPQSQVKGPSLPPFRQSSIAKSSEHDKDLSREAPMVNLLTAAGTPSTSPNNGKIDKSSQAEAQSTGSPKNLLKAYFGGIASRREEADPDDQPLDPETTRKAQEKQAIKMKKVMEKHKQRQTELEDEAEAPQSTQSSQVSTVIHEKVSMPVRDFNARMNEQQRQHDSSLVLPNESLRNVVREIQEEEVGVVTKAYDRMRPRRVSPEMATITIGDRVVTRMVGIPRVEKPQSLTSTTSRNGALSRFSQHLGKFGSGSTSSGKNIGRELSSESENEAIESKQRNTGRQDRAFENHSSGSATEAIRHADLGLMDVEGERVAEEQRVADLIRAAEEKGVASSKDGQKRANQALKGGASKELTVDQIAILDVSLTFLTRQAQALSESIQRAERNEQVRLEREESVRGSVEERLSLTISKADFSKMHIAGQFNMGFIIAIRHKDKMDEARGRDEVFIIDQHASDEKYNFERLQAETVVGNQRLVHAVVLELTAVEEEIVIENEAALRQNGFIIDTDDSGELSVGQRCKLLSLPLSKEVTFNMKDLEELIHLLSDSHVSAHSAYVPRPSKVRKMFAMRACRSSIMIGKTLSKRQMRNILDHMGQLDKPWNCPHGRPTMRHLTSLEKMDGQLWTEMDGVCSDDDGGDVRRSRQADAWKSYME